MKKILIIGLLSLGLASSAFAAEGSAKGLYFGLGFGNTSFSDDEASTYTGTSALVTDTDSGIKLYGGYQFNKVVGIEASYTQFGEFNYGASFGNPINKIEPMAVTVAANVGYNFLDEQLRPYVVAGLSYINMNQTGALYEEGKDVGAGVHYGIGFEYSPSLFAGVGFRVEYSNDLIPVTVIDGATLTTKTLTQNLSLVNVAVQYKF